VDEVVNQSFRVLQTVHKNKGSAVKGDNVDGSEERGVMRPMLTWVNSSISASECCRQLKPQVQHNHVNDDDTDETGVHATHTEVNKLVNQCFVNQCFTVLQTVQQ
jgi:hypothetical protein